MVEIERAAERGDLLMAIALAKDLATKRGHPIQLPTALRLLPLVAAQRQDEYSDWALRWLGRWIGEMPGTTIDQTADVASWLAELPADPDRRLAVNASPPGCATHRFEAPAFTARRRRLGGWYSLDLVVVRERLPGAKGHAASPGPVGDRSDRLAAASDERGSNAMSGGTNHSRDEAHVRRPWFNVRSPVAKSSPFIEGEARCAQFAPNSASETSYRGARILVQRSEGFPNRGFARPQGAHGRTVRGQHWALESQTL